jgi:hydroxymethylpyrimidine pyrophosphatase-like HAD family hydrolase
VRHRLLVTDFDGTLATAGDVRPEVLGDLDRIRESGRKLVLLTGRELPDLIRICPFLNIFERVIAENGAVLYDPVTHRETSLTDPPSAVLLDALTRAGVTPLSRGLRIISTVQPQETKALEVIRDLGLEMTLAFNKGSVMILPSGINKASGLARVLQDLGISAENAVGVGDGENDHIFLKTCGFSVAVANAVPALKAEADWVTQAPNGDGVRELIEKILREDI